MRLVLTDHARTMLAERDIAIEWVEATVTAPELVLSNPGDLALERRYRRIPERGHRILRVVCSLVAGEARIVTVFFDRKAKLP